MTWEGIVTDAVVVAVIYGALQLIQRYLRTRTEVERDYAEIANDIAEGGSKAVDAAVKMLERNEKRMADLEGEIKELHILRDQRTVEMRALEMDVAGLRGQVGLWETKYTELEKKYTRAQKVIEMLIKVLDESAIQMPDELKLLLGDSIHKFKAVK
jgi:chromosome segregation ATPase